MHASHKRTWSPRVARAAILALVASGALAAVAVAATFNGTGGDNVLVGSPSADVMNGKGGNDLIYGNLGDDYIDGGTGSDANLPDFIGLEGGSGDDRVSGGSGNDIIDGDYLNCLVPACDEDADVEVPNNQQGDDSLDGGPGDDGIYGQRGNDTLIGGPGIDLLFGDQDNDRIYARDGQVDYIYCGPGNDLVQYDKNLDVFFNSNEVEKPFEQSDCEGQLTF